MTATASGCWSNWPNHPSLEATPSEGDIRGTRDLIRAGQLLRIELLDRIIMGENHLSLRSLGYFA